MRRARIHALMVAGALACTLAGSSDDARAESGVAQVDDRYGIAVRVGQNFLTKRFAELHWEHAPGSDQSLAYGIQLLRQRGSMTMALGFRYEGLRMPDGTWIDRGDSIPADQAYMVTFRGLTWYSMDASFVWHTSMSWPISFRYGAGIGVGLLRGDVLKEPRSCSSNDVASCTMVAGMAEDAGLPSLFPVLSVFAGFQWRPSRRVAITLDGGLRSVPFVDLSVAVMF